MIIFIISSNRYYYYLLSQLTRLNAFYIPSLSNSIIMVDKLHPTRTQVGVHTREEPKIIWNDKSIKAYLDLDLEVPETLCMFEKRFLSKVDISKGPIERSVMHMVRLKAPDYLGQEKDKTKLPERKEFIYYQERIGGATIGVGFPSIQYQSILKAIGSSNSQGHTLAKRLEK